ncbi:ABC transporter ATP-binding protein [Sinorhizobium terangae]|uniref:sn-glycerol-3-phosphate ABC transporter ATP-binding protein UgpC n=1 Tax=Sinorhizobium terangae TaxID=110322 RepID=A0A6N7LNE6_SINTE|nr:sn-glycerol-3-phosphate ABC transporter ATP-binding protein UgpC [Sinorhizobium terangae]MBB4188902.1 ABC-type sugar transport system ATPase subunit [Sinorhizobium terangae]MQX19267.1 sn-glycerol-3-phosphate ABC transporter ATP-binding protein UgpC [Sinorhizobium terangae]WFU51257.1 sn-glycerol-3-phosphate ABC transporter ATP-binding protein UgpC [Sinorhizobium terangae]
MTQLALRSIRKSYGALEVIRGVDLDVAEGEFVVFVGPSGCGKSTMLRMIAGLEDVTDGTIGIAGRDVTTTAPAKREIAMVFQSYALFPHMTVAENIGFGLKLSGLAKEEISRRVGDVATTLQIGPLLERFPRELSGGQRQRVAIGRAIIRQPKIFLFDEPLSNLDAGLRVQMRLEIARLHARLGATMIYVTHDQTEAMTLADRIVVFNKGKIEQVGAPMELYERPANTFVAGFIGAPSMNFLPAAVDGGNLTVHGTRIERARAWNAAGTVTAGVRPEHLTILPPEEGGIRGRVELIERLGAQTYAYVESEGLIDPITLAVPTESNLAAGDVVGMQPMGDKIHAFDRHGVALAG